MTLAARGTVNISPRMQFYVTAINFSDIPQHLPEHKVVAHTHPPFPIIHHSRPAPPTIVAVRISEKRKPKALSRKSIIFDFIKTVEAAHYKAPSDRAKQMVRHVDVQDENRGRLSHGWRQ